jgi:hypothetical protein
MKNIPKPILAIILLTLSQSYAVTTRDLFYLQEKFNKEDIYQTWYVKQILINGKPDKENFPVNNDEITLKRDYTFTTIDKTFNVTENGKWKWTSADTYLVNGDSGPTSFKILELSKTKLRTSMISDEINMEIIYSTTK